MTVIAKNPILPGFFPDPSICAAGDDFYLVNSTFAYFPGLPILHSKDLAHWEQIGNALDRESQLPLQFAGHSQGLFAPTIRYHEGTFYLICTNVSFGGNFVVTATNPEGPWSEPHYLEGADGIDPSLFYDDDGKCYYIGTHPNKDGCRYNGDYFIWIQELDVNTFKLVGEKKDVWNGAMRNICWPEGPHLYKKGDYYYIMHAEGGTGPDHAVTVCRSKEIFGEYENCFCNPILTHRHLGQAYPIKYVGHADLVETKNGEWYIVMLAVRPLEGFTTMGRETFLAKVTWENDWPVVNPGVGLLTDTVEINLDEWNPATDVTSYTYRTNGKTALPGSNRTYSFADMKELGDEFMGLRKPVHTVSAIDPKKGLALSLSAVSFEGKTNPSYIGVRQQHHVFQSEAVVSTENLTADCEAGLLYCQCDTYYLKAVTNAECARIVLTEKGEARVLAEKTWAKASEDATVTVRFEMNGLSAKAIVQNNDTNETLEFDGIDVRKLSTEVAGGFVGCTVGVYAKAETEKQTKAYIRSLSYHA